MRKLNMRAAVLAAVLAGCGASAENKEGSKPTTSTETAQVTEMTGVYEVNKDLKDIKLPSDAQEAYDKAVKKLTDAGYNPVALLGTQVGSLTNYAVLCTSASRMAKEQKTSWVVLTIYEDLDGNASITNTYELDPNIWTDYSQSASTEAAQ